MSALSSIWEERNRELVRERDEARAFLRRTAMTGGSIVSSAAMTATQIAIARAADRMLVTPDGYGFVYIPGPRFCACGRVESDCDQSRASCPKVDPAPLSPATMLYLSHVATGWSKSVTVTSRSAASATASANVSLRGSGAGSGQRVTVTRSASR